MSSKPCNIHPYREMNNIPLILYKGERKSNKSCGLFFFCTGWTSKWCRKLDYRFLDSLISWLICCTVWISLPKSLNFLFISPLISVRQFLHCNLTTGSCSLSISVPLAILYPNIMITSWESGVFGNHAGPFEYYEGSSLAFSAFWQKKGLPRYIFLHPARKQLADM